MMPLIRKSLKGVINGRHIHANMMLYRRNAIMSCSSSSCSCGTPTEVTGSTRKPTLRLTSLSSLRDLTITHRQYSRISSTSGVSTAIQENHVRASMSQWDLFAGIVVERKPIITANKNELQEKYTKCLAQLEFELSKKSNHEIRHRSDLYEGKMLKHELNIVLMNLDDILIVSLEKCLKRSRQEMLI